MDIQGTEKEQATKLLLALSFDRYLIEELNKRDESNRIYAVYFLGLMGDQQSLARIRELIWDRSGLIRMMAASTLMQLQDTESIPVILEEFGQQGDREYKSHLISYLMEFGSGLLAELERIFRTQDLVSWVTEACMDIFGHYVYINVTDKILELLHDDPDIEIRIAAVRTLSRFEDLTLLDFFKIQLNDDNYAIQAYSAKALGLIGDHQVIPSLKKTVFSPDFWVVKRSIEALHRMGEEGTETLYQILAENHSERINHLIIEVQTA
jgi:HEAT repeat protein